MYYTNKEIFVLSAVGCMGTERDGLDSIMAGSEEGAKGCCLSVDMTADGIAVLSSDGYCIANDGSQMSISDYTYSELHQAAPQLVPAGQAIELARTCNAKIAIMVHNQTLLPQLRITLRHSEWLDNTIFVGLGLVEAARIAVANPELHIMGELPAVPDNIDALVRAAQTTGLFGLRAAPSDLTPSLITACRRAGLFTMSLQANDEATLGTLIARGVNFIETTRPDVTSMLLPNDQTVPPQIPLIRY